MINNNTLISEFIVGRRNNTTYINIDFKYFNSVNHTAEFVHAFLRSGFSASLLNQLCPILLTEYTYQWVKV